MHLICIRAPLTHPNKLVRQESTRPVRLSIPELGICRAVTKSSEPRKSGLWTRQNRCVHNVKDVPASALREDPGWGLAIARVALTAYQNTKKVSAARPA